MQLVKFSDLTGEIETIYTGRGRCSARCFWTRRPKGRGNFFAPGSKGFTRALNKITKINPIVNCIEQLNFPVINTALATQEAGKAISNSADWIDLCLPNDRCITVYYKFGTLVRKNA